MNKHFKIGRHRMTHFGYHRNADVQAGLVVGSKSVECLFSLNPVSGLTTT